jgi:anti-sigma factor ChrR (cupin superfamily)
MRSDFRNRVMGTPQDRSDFILSDELAGVMASALPAAPELDKTEKEALKRRVMARLSLSEKAAPAPEGTYTVRASESPWQTVSDLVQIRVVRTDRARNNQTVLIRMMPGASIVPHPHTQEEECLVIEGAVEIGEHRLYEGDMHVASAGVKHPRITSPLGALLMIRSEIPPAGYAIA